MKNVEEDQEHTPVWEGVIYLLAFIGFLSVLPLLVLFALEIWGVDVFMWINAYMKVLIVEIIAIFIIMVGAFFYGMFTELRNKGEKNYES